MQTFSRLLALSLLAATLAWLILARSPRQESDAATQLPGTPPAPGASTTGSSQLPKPPSPTRPEASRPEDAPLRPPPLELSTGPLAWELQLAAADARGRDAKGKAREILALLPRLPEEALATAAEQAVARLPNADYAATALPVLTDPRTHGQVLSVLFADLMERPDAIALPALLTLAQNPAHPFARAAQDNLRLLLRDNFGSDWNQWREAVAAALAP